MDKILILFFSGVKNTKNVAESMYINLNKIYYVDIYSVEKLSSYFDICQYDKIIIGTPTIHSEPAKPMRDYLNSLDKLEKPLPAFLFVTCGLYPENTLRVFSKLCLEKNIIPVMHSAYRCSATDGVLLAPFIEWFWHDEKKIYERINQDVKNFISINSIKPKIPRYKWYGILNFPNKWLGKYLRFKIFLHQEKCVKCGRCVLNCPMQAINKQNNGYPQIERRQCINCYRCIHHCPHKALSLFFKRTHKKTLY